MGNKKLGITLISASNIEDVNRFTTMDVYAHMSVKDPYNPKQKQVTPRGLDTATGTYPRFDQTATFNIDEDAALDHRVTIKIKLISWRLTHDKEIGRVYVHINKLLDAKAKGENMITSPLTTRWGYCQGTVKFSFRFENSFGQTTSPKCPDPVKTRRTLSFYPNPYPYPFPYPYPYSYPQPPPVGHPPPISLHGHGNLPAIGFPTAGGGGNINGWHPLALMPPEEPQKNMPSKWGVYEHCDDNDY